MKSVTVCFAFLVTLISFCTASVFAGTVNPLEKFKRPCDSFVRVFEYQKSTFFEDIHSAARLSDHELIQHIDKLLQRELNAHNGELTGIGTFHGGLKGFLMDMAATQTNELLPNYLGNALGATVYRLIMPGDVIRVTSYDPELGPTFGMQEYIYFKVLTDRLNSNPSRMYQEVGLHFPTDTSDFKNSLARVNGVFAVVKSH